MGQPNRQFSFKKKMSKRFWHEIFVCFRIDTSYVFRINLKLNSCIAYIRNKNRKEKKL